MPINLKKGQKADLTGDGFALKKLIVEFGWDPGNSPDLELDVFAFLLGTNGKIPSNPDVVYLGNVKHKSGCVILTDNSDCYGKEILKIDLSSIPSNIERISLVLNIRDSVNQKQNFSLVRDICVCIVDEISGNEIVSYKLDENFSFETAIVVGEVYRYKGEWRFNAIGSGFKYGIEALFHMYGADVNVQKRKLNQNDTESIPKSVKENQRTDHCTIDKSIEIKMLEEIRSVANAAEKLKSNADKDSVDQYTEKVKELNALIKDLTANTEVE